MHTFLRGTSAAAGTARRQVNGGEVRPTNDLLVRGSTASLVSSIPRTSQPPVPTVPERLSIAISIHHRPVRPVMLLSFYCCSSLAQGDARTRLYATSAPSTNDQENGQGETGGSNAARQRSRFRVRTSLNRELKR